MHLKGIYQNEEKIKNLIKKPLGNITQPKKYYLVNNDWFKNYKKIYKYDYYLNVWFYLSQSCICNIRLGQFHNFYDFLVYFQVLNNIAHLW